MFIMQLCIIIRNKNVKELRTKTYVALAIKAVAGFEYVRNRGIES